MAAVAEVLPAGELAFIEIGPQALGRERLAEGEIEAGGLPLAHEGVE